MDLDLQAEQKADLSLFDENDEPFMDYFTRDARIASEVAQARREEEHRENIRLRIHERVERVNWWLQHEDPAISPKKRQKLNHPNDVDEEEEKKKKEQQKEKDEKYSLKVRPFREYFDLYVPLNPMFDSNPAVKFYFHNRSLLLFCRWEEKYEHQRDWHAVRLIRSLRHHNWLIPVVDLEKTLDWVAKRKKVHSWKVGITINPLDRWNGREMENGFMEGLWIKYRTLYVECTECCGESGALERALIKKHKDDYRQKNLLPGGEGQSYQDPHFCYVAVK